MGGIFSIFAPKIDTKARLQAEGWRRLLRERQNVINDKNKGKIGDKFPKTREILKTEIQYAAAADRAAKRNSGTLSEEWRVIAKDMNAQRYRTALEIADHELRDHKGDQKYKDAYIKAAHEAAEHNLFDKEWGKRMQEIKQRAEHDAEHPRDPVELTAVELAYRRPRRAVGTLGGRRKTKAIAKAKTKTKTKAKQRRKRNLKSRAKLVSRLRRGFRYK